MGLESDSVNAANRNGRNGRNVHNRRNGELRSPTCTVQTRHTGREPDTCVGSSETDTKQSKVAEQGMEA
eukprot:4321131-Prymnesium_polylepis.2